MFDNIWFQIIVFPGLVFLLGWTFFVFYFARKTLAYIHKRVGGTTLQWTSRKFTNNI